MMFYMRSENKMINVKNKYCMKEQIIKIIENSSPELAAEEILDLFGVIKHRELLIDFYKSFYSDVGWLTHKEDAIEYIDKYLKSINS